FFELLETLRARDITVILSTHSIDLAYAWADTAFVLDRGKLVATCQAPAFAKVFPTFSPYGLGIPQVLQLHQALQAQGYIPEGSAVPRDLPALCASLQPLPQEAVCSA
ncbi:MAG TPA: hypothetical protein VN436_08015, partial [Holophaga sp.]|nr:hypothetical protein [Holophaga sp.]